MNLVVVSLPEIKDNNKQDACSAWKAAGLVEQIARYVTRAVWASLQPGSPYSKRKDRIIATISNLANAVHTIHSAGAFPLILGGGSTITALGTLLGLQKSGIEPAVVWFDGNNPLVTIDPPFLPPLAVLTGIQRDPLTEQAGFTNPIPQESIMVAGVRHGVNQEDLEIPFWSAEELESTGVDPFERVSFGSTPMYLHIDLGVLDPSIMPAVNNPVNKGLSLETLISSIDAVSAVAPAAALGISNFQPDKDIDSLGLATSLEAISSAIRILAIE